MIEKILLLIITYSIIELSLELITQIFKIIKRNEIFIFIEYLIKGLTILFIILCYLYVSGIIQLIGKI